MVGMFGSKVVSNWRLRGEIERDIRRSGSVLGHGVAERDLGWNELT